MAKHVDGFELVEPDGGGFLGPSYAAWANYPFFNYRGDTYERIDGGGVIIRRGKTRPTEFLVREDVIAKDKNGRVEKSRLSVLDRKTGEVMASRYLRDGQVENGRGWVGEHAVKFIRQVLIPDKPIGGAVGVERYPRFVTEIETLALSDVPAVSTPILECDGDFYLDGFPKRLTTDSWRFLPQSPISNVVCSEDSVFVFSNPFPKDVYVDMLSSRGDFLTQFVLQVPVPYVVRLHRVDHLQIRSDGVSFNLHYSKTENRDGVSHWSPHSRWRVLINWPDGVSPTLH